MAAGVDVCRLTCALAGCELQEEVPGVPFEARAEREGEIDLVGFPPGDRLLDQRQRLLELVLGDLRQPFKFQGRSVVRERFAAVAPVEAEPQQREGVVGRGRECAVKGFGGVIAEEAGGMQSPGIDLRFDMRQRRQNLCGPGGRDHLAGFFVALPVSACRVKQNRRVYTRVAHVFISFVT